MQRACQRRPIFNEYNLVFVAYKIGFVVTLPKKIQGNNATAAALPALPVLRAMAANSVQSGHYWSTVK
jgi:hypothetical protein